jgi:hypothetical protein
MAATVDLAYTNDFDPAVYTFPSPITASKVKTLVEIMKSMINRGSRKIAIAKSSHVDIATKTRYLVTLTLTP